MIRKKQFCWQLVNLILGLGGLVWVTSFAPLFAIKVTPNTFLNEIISDENKKADNPILAQAPNGQLMVVFNQWVADDADDSDPYYVVSTNNGESWTNPLPIATLADTKSTVALTYDSTNVAHAVWAEIKFGDTKVFYANRQTGSWSNPIELLEEDAFSLVHGVSIVASRPGIIDVLWDREPKSSSRIIEHKRFIKNSQQEWIGADTVVVSDIEDGSLLPSIASDDNGNLHAVWQTEFGKQIYYSRLNTNENSWKKPSVLISTDILTNKSYEPDIAIFDNSVYIGIAYRETVLPDTNQAVFERHCPNATSANSCLNPTAWSLIRNVSGSFLKVIADDQYYVSPQFMSMQSSQYRRSNLFLLYHGFTLGDTGNEIVWRTDSCSNWAGALPAQLTASDLRSIRPHGQARASGINIDVHIVYENVSNSPDERLIYYARSSSNCGRIYLPLIQK